jgi:hypothetical protein
LDLNLRVLVAVLDIKNRSIGDGIPEVGDELVDHIRDLVGGILSVIFHVQVRISGVSIVVTAVAIVVPDL